MKSISMTRLKHKLLSTLLGRRWHLKWKASRWRDWNHNTGIGDSLDTTSLKWKASRWRDWNVLIAVSPASSPAYLKWKASRWRDWNSAVAIPNRRLRSPEMKSLSIARLKLNISCKNWTSRVSLKWKASRWRDWNQAETLAGREQEHEPWNEKHLDDEIET